MLTMHEKSREDTAALMAGIGRRARGAARPLAIAGSDRKQRRWPPWPRRSYAASRRDSRRQRGRSRQRRARPDWRRLHGPAEADQARIRDMADGIRAIAGLPIRSAR